MPRSGIFSTRASIATPDTLPSTVSLPTHSESTDLATAPPSFSSNASANTVPDLPAVRVPYGSLAILEG